MHCIPVLGNGTKHSTASYARCIQDRATKLQNIIAPEALYRVTQRGFWIIVGCDAMGAKKKKFDPEYLGNGIEYFQTAFSGSWPPMGATKRTHPAGTQGPPLGDRCPQPKKYVLPPHHFKKFAVTFGTFLWTTGLGPKIFWDFFKNRCVHFREIGCKNFWNFRWTLQLWRLPCPSSGYVDQVFWQFLGAARLTLRPEYFAPVAPCVFEILALKLAPINTTDEPWNSRRS